MVRQTTQTNKPRLSLKQVLATGGRAGRFYAVVINPADGKRLCEVPFWDMGPNDNVEVAIERLTLFDVEELATDLEDGR